ncbi:hypothetical protein C2G38_2208643 [Gigaspora rosea]|uniref:HCP-like protein n=1 Tax=Gigaspora rosea TaxID=44941 RepID=A0A397UGX2_9GLOM|nr:hypothetical protein C2G38_2208643 [Gigaspora rosea]
MNKEKRSIAYSKDTLRLKVVSVQNSRDLVIGSAPFFTAAMVDLGDCYKHGMRVEMDENKAFIYYQKSASMGNVREISNLGFCYLNGIGVKKNEYKAFIYYQRSANIIIDD